MKFKRTLGEDSEFIPLASTADITFLLIIFFLVTTTFNVEKGINMQLPDTVVQEEIPTDNITISLDAESRVFVDGREVETDQVGRIVKEQMVGNPDRFVIIKSDKGVAYGRVVDILDELFQVGIHNVALPTKKESIGEEAPGGS